MKTHPIIRWSLASVLLLLSLAIITDAADAQAPPFQLEPIATGFERPLYVAEYPGQPGLLFVVEQTGKILLVDNSETLETPFLDISDLVTGGSEQGLLGLALHPDFIDNGLFFVNFTDLAGNTNVVRYRVMESDPFQADPSTATTILQVEQPARNHNGGGIAFGPDGYLYIGLGDGGNQGDPEGNGQNPGTLLGSILRIDIDNTSAEKPYAIPADNPFVDDPTAQPEIWSYGFRNPWRFSFDRETGDLWIGDVGQNNYEEIDLQPAGDGGMNFGWNLSEGDSCYAVEDCDTGEFTWPEVSYSHDFGTSVTGGYLYRGNAMPDLVGSYLFGDFGSGFIWIHQPGGEESVTLGPFDTGINISSFGEGLDGELFVVGYDGTIYRLVQA